ncbi:MAG: RlmE family RNA methyltransferase [Termitinemataceae bacterium]|nr:MAG: RlmE family RNA methyltransferase [Termitinemataceae bacterium]
MTNYKTLDSWSIKAQKEGYPARSVYKLQEIDEKFHLLAAQHSSKQHQFKVLDLGAAPGSWSLFVLRKLQNNVFLSACDLSPLSTVHGKTEFAQSNIFFLQGDIENDKNKTLLCEKGPYNLIICDAAPATTGNRTVDTERSLSLVETCFIYAKASLVKGGAVVTKIFQGSGSADFLKSIKSEFEKLTTFKPKACRPNSFEMYAVGIGKKEGIVCKTLES